ncbi:MAG: hypothetical protein A2390_00365 [Candidatus Liptonbacteria bacterium RIFOXYB1_FULL_36_10]|uniref:Plasmid stabilization protein n=2 Tax=Candidatus Liptoniibacteriota TaxID=1817909 RepID=A0A1G2CNI1_9BACT|nr:MAG: hypothetical protein A2390_00365 [Candidatus Liptonbacteria bacterium RIFOXYB1_FULL_36_10]OGZ04609.1 MAG: hypothetical protein A2604_00310 [Candidatus Liptonbacteria bacterium RIFOXYD1_FULL_36_11]
MEVYFKPTFVRQFKLFEEELQEEILEKVELFKNSKNHKQLKVHKLKGRLSNHYGFSANYQIRIVFNYISKEEVVLLAVGSHEVYK